MERLQKILAAAGIASRRAAEQLIVAGRVRVNGKVVTELGTRANARRDKIELDGKRIVAEHLVYYVLHKPRGIVTTLEDPEGRPTIKSLLRGVTERVFPVGRLDFHTSGALLLSNDGAFAEALTRPRKRVPKVYAVKLKGMLADGALEKLRKGVRLDDNYMTKPAEIVVLREENGNTWAQFTLFEGKNRQIHRMAEAVGHRVQRLARLSFAGIGTEGLKPGEMRELTEKELTQIRKKFVPTTPTKAKPKAPLADESSFDPEGDD